MKLGFYIFCICVSGLCSLSGSFEWALPTFLMLLGMQALVFDALIHMVCFNVNKVYDVVNCTLSFSNGSYPFCDESTVASNAVCSLVLQ